MKVEFKEWAKTPRLLRDIVITEKIDGTNAAVQIIPIEEMDRWMDEGGETTAFFDPQPIAVIGGFALYAQSRSRLIFPGKMTDNYGFAGWVERNAATLVEDLGAGIHYGEWWGQGIQRSYGAKEKYFSLFNTARYDAEAAFLTSNLGVVPVLYEGPFDQREIDKALSLLSDKGSRVYEVQDFSNPEGICVYHSASRQVFKVTLDKNDANKWEAA